VDPASSKKKVDLPAIMVDNGTILFGLTFCAGKYGYTRCAHEGLKECQDELLRLSIVLAGDQIFQECADVRARACLGMFMF
jgi:hypothetical protein